MRAAAAAVFAFALAHLGCDQAPKPLPASSSPPSPARSEPPPAFEPPVRSLRLRRSIAVRQYPRGESPFFGTVARDIRVGFRSATVGPDCESRWIEIEPRGWVCEKYLEASEKPPKGVELPKLSEDEIVPGEYGKVRPGTESITLEGEEWVVARRFEGSVTVRKLAERDIEDEPHWGIGKGEWVVARAIAIHEPSRHVGVALGGEAGLSLPIVFAFDGKSPGRNVETFVDRDRRDRGEPMLPRTAAPLVEEDGELLRIGAARWIARDKARLVRAAPAPAAIGEGERWIDVDLDSQVLVAYEGSEAVYATLISSGRGKNATPTGVHRIWIKFAETTMTGGMADDGSTYSVATVPWTQFYANDLALHTAYWHDQFGLPRSHGCINLSPRDARFLYFWSEPRLPLGWSMAHGDVRFPGSIVRIRSQADPSPEFLGYAKKVRELSPKPAVDDYLRASKARP